MCNEQSEREIREVFPFKITWEGIKHLELNLTTEERLYIEDYRTFSKRIKEDLIKWKGSPCLFIANMLVLLKVVNRLNLNLIKILRGFFKEFLSRNIPISYGIENHPKYTKIKK